MKREKLNVLSKKIIGLAMKIHLSLGPGFIEKIYGQAPRHELNKAGVEVKHQQEILIEYDGIKLGKQRVDLLVEDEIIVELKAVSELLPIHEAQIISYLKAADKRLGLIFNFAPKSLKFKRVVNRF